MNGISETCSQKEREKEKRLRSFHYPNDYEEVTTSQGRHGHGLTVDQLTEDDELWIVRLPKTLDTTSLLHTKIKLKKTVTLETQDSELYSCAASDHGTLSKYSLLLPSTNHRNFELVPQQFSGEINITKDEITSQVQAPIVQENTLCASNILRKSKAVQRFSPSGTEFLPFKKEEIKSSRAKRRERDSVIKSSENNELSNGVPEKRSDKKKKRKVEKAEETNASSSAQSHKKKKKQDVDVNTISPKTLKKRHKKHSDKSPEKSPKKKRKHSEIDETLSTIHGLTNESIDESSSKKKKRKHSKEEKLPKIKLEVLSECEVESSPENPPLKKKFKVEFE